MLPPRFLPAFLTPRFGRCLSLEMLRDGWAVTYEQAGAVYGKWGKEHFLELEAKAKLVVYTPLLSIFLVYPGILIFIRKQGGASRAVGLGCAERVSCGV